MKKQKSVSSFMFILQVCITIAPGLTQTEKEPTRVSEKFYLYPSAVHYHSATFDAKREGKNKSQWVVLSLPFWCALPQRHGRCKVTMKKQKAWKCTCVDSEIISVSFKSVPLEVDKCLRRLKSVPLDLAPLEALKCSSGALRGGSKVYFWRVEVVPLDGQNCIFWSLTCVSDAYKCTSGGSKVHLRWAKIVFLEPLKCTFGGSKLYLWRVKIAPLEAWNWISAGSNLYLWKLKSLPLQY